MKLDRSLVISLLLTATGFALILILAPLVRPTQQTTPIAPASTPVIYDLEGINDDILTFDIPNSGPVTFHTGYAGGRGVFSVKIRDEAGGLRGTVAMCHEHCDREALLELKAGLHYAEVRCPTTGLNGLDCEWYLVIAPLVQ